MQRRAVARAESQLDQYSNEVDVIEDDEIIDIENEDVMNSSELHYNIADLIGTILKTHKTDFYHIYMSQWHEIVMNLSHPYCLKEDRLFAFYIISDMFDYGLVYTDNNNNNDNINNNNNNLIKILEC